MSNDILETLGKTITSLGAPLLGSVLGGQFGIVGGIILDTVIKAFDADSQSPTDLIAKIQADPAAKQKLCGIEENCRPQLEKIAASPVNPVPVVEAESQPKTNFDLLDKKNAFILAITYTGCFFVYLFLIILLHKLSDPNIQSITSFLEAGEMLVLGYYFASSASSARKDEFIRSMKK